MPRNLQSIDIPLTGAGEQSAAAVGQFAPGEAWRLENGQIVGLGIVAQVGDWRLAATLKNATGTPLRVAQRAMPWWGSSRFHRSAGSPGPPVVWRSASTPRTTRSTCTT
jgi:hypothetical protein